MVEIVAPNYFYEVYTEWRLRSFDSYKSVFLAGGITGCEDWQTEMVKLLSDTDLLLFNPRRHDFDTSNKENSIMQIQWEHVYLSVTSAVLFWFPRETVCPITLFELGYQLGCFSARANKKIFVGTHPEYSRRLDVVEQIRMVTNSIEVVDSLQSLSLLVKEYSNAN